MKKLITFLAILVSLKGSATTYYISTTGNDGTGTGTIGNPWLTLFKATSVVTTAGDIIHVTAGTYTETATCDLAVGVSIEGEGVSSVIKGTMTAQFTTIIEAGSAEGTDGSQHISNLKFDGTNIASQIAIRVGGRSNVSIYNCTIENFNESGCVIGGRDNGNPLPPTIYATGNSFHDNIVNNCAQFNGVGSGCLMIGGQIGLLIYNNTITQTQRPNGENGWPIKYYSEGWTKGLKIYNNTLTKIPYQTGGGWSFCLELFNGEGTEIYGNTIQGSIDLNFSQRTVNYPYTYFIHDNTIKQPSQSNYNEEGIIFEYGFNGVRIEDNVFENLNQGIVFYPRTGTELDSFKINGNLFKNMGGSATDGYDGYIIGGFGGALGNWKVRQWDVYNNTLISAATNKIEWGCMMSMNNLDTIDGFRFKNNIIDGVAYTIYTQDKSYWTNSDISYNDIYNTQDDNLLFQSWYSGGPWGSGSSDGNNLVTINPLYVGGGSYALQPSSPLIDAGTNVGLPFNGSAPDIGYAEYGSGGNASPTANAGPDQSITLPTNSVILSGSGTDPDGTITAYLWTKVSGPAAGTITAPTTAATSVTALVQGVYQFELRVTDNNGAFGRDTIQVTVNPAPNVAPVANAGSDQSITLPINYVSLSGSGTDVDGTISAYLWTKVSGPAAGTINTPNTATTTVTGLIQGVYKFELSVTDNSGASGKDTMQVIVFALNVPPVSNAGLNQSITLPTNTSNLFGSGTDVDGSITTYLWTKISGPAAGTITNPNAAITVATGLAQGVYQFELRVMDNSGAFGRDTMQVTVNPENIAPFANAGPDQTIVLPSNKVTLSGSGVDVDGTIIAYSWRQIYGPVDKLTSTNTAITVLDNLVKGNYKFELTVTDNKGAIGKDSVNVNIISLIIPAENSIKNYPNPVIDFTTLDINTTVAKQSIVIVVTDIQGRNIYNKQLVTTTYNTKEKINMSNLSKGTYMITVYFGNEEKQTIKAIKD
jgi:hypothetical protein